MKRILICEATSTSDVYLIKKLHTYIIIFLLFALFFADFLDLLKEDTYGLFIILLAFIGWSGHHIQPPQIKTDNLCRFSYIKYLNYCAVKSTTFCQFLVTEQRIILYNKYKKVTVIPYSEFEQIDLKGFANLFNKKIRENDCFEAHFEDIKNGARNKIALPFIYSDFRK